MKQRKIALIPARFGASRFPGKLMADLAGKPVIVRTYEAVVKTHLFDEVVVVGDNKVFQEAIEAIGGKYFQSQQTHECGTDRIAEASQLIEGDIFVNVQGDEPFTQRKSLEALLAFFENDFEKKIQVATLMQKMHKEEDINDPNFVKLVVDKENNALLFSRSPIPYRRDKNIPIDYYEHIGVYAFRKNTLIDFPKMPQTPLELVEKVECLRFLENGIAIKVALVDYMGIEIDTPQDLIKANEYYKTIDNE
jgi:3-deoxy-manno-octulosonate cytidylyltransferase (CMP-KDO synthetase)